MQTNVNFNECTFQVFNFITSRSFQCTIKILLNMTFKTNYKDKHFIIHL